MAAPDVASCPLEIKARLVPDEWALKDPASTYSWLDLWDVVQRGVAVVSDLDMAPGQRVAVMARNSAATVVGYLSALYAGASVIPVSFHLTPPEVAYILRDGNAVAVLCDRESEAVVREAVRECGISQVLVWGDAAGVQESSASSSWTRALDMTEPSGIRRDVPPRPNLLYTSGTTGFPKGVERPPVVPETLGEYVDAMGVRAGSGPFLVCGPLYHTGPQRSIQRLAGGRPVYILPTFDAQTVLATIEEQRITGTLMVPTHFMRLLGLPEEIRTAFDVSSMKELDHTGAACPIAVKQAMIDWFGPVLTEKYGGTESGSLCSITSQEWLAHPGSVGRCVHPFQAMAVDDAGEPLPPGTEGRLFFRDTTGRGIQYHGAPDKTAEVHLAPDVFTVGDSGYVDEDGYVYITGRHSDMVISGGVNLYPAESERVLRTHPQVIDVAVIGVPHPTMGEELKALVVRADESVDQAELIAFCRDNLAHPKCPRTVDFVDDLGRNLMGKVNKKQLAAPYWEAADSAPAT